jgi:gliding motility-associated-like protein
MKKHYLLLVAAIMLCCSNYSVAQIVGGNVFLQGHWVEIGELPNGAFGACSSPAGYHPHVFGTNLAEVYDYGHDGWTVGTPPYMGDYTYPGSPFEGWELQIGAGRCQAFQNCAGSMTSSGLTMTGSITAYTNTAQRITSMWTGTSSTLSIKQETRVDTNASWVVVTTKFYNTSTTTAVNNVYYMRSCDPDNDESWPGGSFFTNNVVNYQNDADHRVEVTATGQSSTLPPLSLGTKDCRAVALIYSWWPLSSGTDLSTLWNKTYTPAQYTVGTPDNGDIGIALVYKLGNIAANDSAVISYAYIFDGYRGIDSAFPEPTLVVNGLPAPPSGAAPASTIDTFDACAHPGMTSLPVDISFAEDKDWTWSSWTWSPGTGLSSTTGAHVVITTTGLPPVITYTIVGTDSGVNMLSCNFRTMYLTVITCNNTVNNSPCEGDTLWLKRIGDSTGCTYRWFGPGWTGGFTSTSQYAFKYPALLTDSGMYYVIRNHSGVSDTDSTYVIIHPKPIVNLTSNAPLCQGMLDTLNIFLTPATAGETFSWSSTTGYTSTVQNPVINPFTSADTGFYFVTATTSFGCQRSASIHAGMVPQPPPPIVTDRNYCQGEPFTPFMVTGLAPGGVPWWYTGPTGGAGTTTYPVVNTAAPGVYVVWASQKVGSCESNRSSDTVHVTTTPGAPAVAGRMEYCQYVGPVDTMRLTLTRTGRALWYTIPAGGVGLPVEPLPNINIAGTYNYWVSQIDSGCEGPRTPVTIIIHPQPAPPAVTPQKYCQFATPDTLIAHGAGGLLTWYGVGILPTGTTSVPTPHTDTPGVETFYVTETSRYGCISQRARDTVLIIAQPVPPRTTDTTYCQKANAVPLNAGVDSLIDSRLNWFAADGTPLGGTPVPPTDVVGTTTWKVSQTVNTCTSEKSQIKVTILYTPVFSITPSSAWLCQFDSIKLAYTGPVLVDPAYSWTLPTGAGFVGRTHYFDSLIYVHFDVVSQQNIVKLHVSDYHGRCFGDTSIKINVVALPTATSTTKQDVCLGDTVTLALNNKTTSAVDFKWYVDSTQLMGYSGALNIIAATDNPGGPFNISWTDSGQHVIKLISITAEGCTSLPTYDSVFVHTVPDASFTYTTRPGVLCLEDSVLFTATASAYNYSYQWAPAHFFNNVNKPSTWGKVEQARSVVTLTVTDPFGCAATETRELDPSTCCTVTFPSAFTPNGDGKNDVFRPIFSGFHRFHSFRIANRWGQTIFQSNDNGPKWDGTYNGVPQDMGTYYYFIKYDCGGKTMEASGDVTLIR